jgi:hypothetical protein
MVGRLPSITFKTSQQILGASANEGREAWRPCLRTSAVPPDDIP